ncbi:Hsp20/alpha crystallin family protein [Lentibacillus halophilus]|uniref:Hsp20/alpha crystallin family protein n=1 Tax=Lentibacillus halophilus TaxID=295065 RepID=A0ABN0Z8E8_9BACI
MIIAGLIPFNERHPKFPSNPFNMIDDFFNDFPTLKRNLVTDPFKVDVKETDNEYLVEAELPGVNKEDIDLSLNDDGKLTIAVHRTDNNDKNDEDDNYIHRERHYESMQRTLYLAHAKPDSVSAKMDNGLLNVTIGKQDQSVDNTRKIDIQ